MVYWLGFSVLSTAAWVRFLVREAHLWASLVAQLVTNPPAMGETWVGSLGWEDPLEKGTGYPLQYSGLENSMDCMYSPWGHKESDTTERL